MTPHEAQTLLHTHLDVRVVEALEVLLPNKLPSDTGFSERDICVSIGEQRVVTMLKGVVARREQKLRDAADRETLGRLLSSKKAT